MHYGVSEELRANGSMFRYEVHVVLATQMSQQLCGVAPGTNMNLSRQAICKARG